MENLVYVGDAGRRNGTLYTRLSAHLKRSGWQTAFRRKVFEHVIGIAEKPRTNTTYRDRLKQSHDEITEAINRNFAFKCVATRNFADLEVWLIHKYDQQLWNKQKYRRKIVCGDLTQLENKLLQSMMVHFSRFDNQSMSIPNESGVYIVFKIN